MADVFIRGIDGDSAFEWEARQKLLAKAESDDILDRLDAISELEAIPVAVTASTIRSEPAIERALTSHVGNRPIHELHMRHRRAAMLQHD